MKQSSRVAALVLAVTVLGLAGCKATPPGKAETKVADWTKHHVTVGGKKDVNPVKATEESIEDGKQLFNSYCMVCHGLDGQNTGVPFADTLSPRVPSLASPETQSYTDGQLKWIIKNGLYPSGMPPSDGEFSNDEMWRMVVYIRHLPPKGSLGVPPVYSGK
ncbi:Cytochrome C oxidase, cbb3-type, subunit III [Granulicella pectinivorans]|uniref:Cytochrome C oxidase, cbb3-type, subunit III n=1 Tax=Granulicella pectinivorans TaxID=474950 RepID=A0A1I6M5T6_9BACT|nr:cytochrome c [Granulicella pectinivorans]SFS11070.1 Cytochrome C oxidase, cbb3-type, subunit III [Granulicella pectinivorans]